MREKPAEISWQQRRWNLPCGRMKIIVDHTSEEHMAPDHLGRTMWYSAEVYVRNHRGYKEEPIRFHILFITWEALCVEAIINDWSTERYVEYDVEQVYKWQQTNVKVRSAEPMTHLPWEDPPICSPPPPPKTYNVGGLGERREGGELEAEEERGLPPVPVALREWRERYAEHFGDDRPGRQFG